MVLDESFKAYIMKAVIGFWINFLERQIQNLKDLDFCVISTILGVRVQTSFLVNVLPEEFT